MSHSPTPNRLLVLATWIMCCCLNTTEAARPNFIIIMADDLGYGDISCFDGWIETPRIDQLAAEGLRLTDYHSNGAVCSPTRAAMMTGRYQQRVGVPGVIVARRDAAVHRTGIGDSEVTFAEALKQHGYATAIFGKWHLGYLPKFNPRHHGFNEFRGYVSGNVDFFSHVDQAGHLDWWRNETLHDEKGYVTHLITSHAVRFIGQNQKRPFCLYLAHEAPHYPYQGPGDSPERTVGGKFVNHGSRKDKKNAYREMVEAMDSSVGQVIDTLIELGLNRNTLVFFCSDNGATRLGSNGPLRGNKGSVWEGGHRVPAIAWWPGQIAPATSSETAMSMDLLPTTLARAEVPPPQDVKIDGTDLSPLLLGTGQLPKRVLYWSTGRGLAVRDGKWKLVKNGEDMKSQLFNLSDDPSESNDISREHPNKLKDLEQRLITWQNVVQPKSTR